MGGRRVGGAHEGQRGVQGRVVREEDRQPGVRGRRQAVQVRRLRLHRLRPVAGEGGHHLRQRHHHGRCIGGGRLRAEVEGPQRGGEGQEEGGGRCEEGGGEELGRQGGR